MVGKVLMEVAALVGIRAPVVEAQGQPLEVVSLVQAVAVVAVLPDQVMVMD